MRMAALPSYSSRIKTSAVVLLCSVVLSSWFRMSLTSLSVIIILTLLVFLVGSITRLCISVLISMLLYSTLLGLIDVIGVNEQLIYPFTVWGRLLWVTLLLMVVKIYQLHIDWKLDASAAALAFLGVFLLAGRNTFKIGNAFASIFPNEDNAAWILTLHRATAEHPKGGGNFGPLFDLLLYFSHFLIDLLVPNRPISDSFANAIVGTHMTILLIVPFISVAIVVQLNKSRVDFKSSIGEVLVFALGLQVIWIHFITSGHMSTGLSAISIIILLMFLSFDSPGHDVSNRKILLVQMSLTFAASSIWFPIAPLALLILMMISARSWRTQNSRFYTLVLVALGSSLIVVRELLPRFDTFRTEDSSLLSGALNLLKMEGGVGSTGPYSFAWILLFLLVLLIVLPMTETPKMLGQILSPLIVGLLTVVGLKIINLRQTNGVVNYGARKYESVLIIIALVFFGAIIMRYLSSRISSSSILALTIGVAISLFSQLPAIEQFLSGRTYFGTKDPQLQQLGRSISESLAIGDDVVCMGEPAQTDRYFVYTCSRWTSAYTDKDDLIKNEWRKAVLGEIPVDMMPPIREQLNSTTKVVVIGAKVSIPERNPTWEFLINENWQLIFARDY
jgi:hypothetical protein